MKIALDKFRTNKAALMRVTNVVLLAVLIAPFTHTERSPAGFSNKVTRVVVEIDGVSYGAFDPVSSAVKSPDFGIEVNSRASGPLELTLTRHFVTDQSLYKWADQRMRGQTRLQDVVLVLENSEGAEISRKLLKSAQPISAVVEASGPEVGGLLERVRFAYHEEINL